MSELEELNLLNQLIELGAKAAHAHAQSNSDDGHKGTAAYVQWHELRAEMGELIRAAYAPQANNVLEDAARYDWLFGPRTAAQAVSVPDTVFKPLPQDDVLSQLQGFYMSKSQVNALVDAARKQGGV